MDQVSFQNGFVCGMAAHGLVSSREYASAGSTIIGYPVSLYKQDAISGLYTNVLIDGATNIYTQGAISGLYTTVVTETAVQL